MTTIAHPVARRSTTLALELDWPMITTSGVAKSKLNNRISSSERYGSRTRMDSMSVTRREPSWDTVTTRFGVCRCTLNSVMTSECGWVRIFCCGSSMFQNPKLPRPSPNTTNALSDVGWKIMLNLRRFTDLLRLEVSFSFSKLSTKLRTKRSNDQRALM